jgi:hypothetical protein
MSFPIFKKALKQIPVEENEYLIEELKFKWRKIKLELKETTDINQQQILDDKKRRIKQKIL